ncbi:uncharacterized protein LOC141601664 [Silene latifolia]|uniref:uncharacterized protein LOC141601664 n=1 Tax=Silene latifolia TaxID=37657 RepID=UPI003D76DB67
MQESHNFSYHPKCCRLGLTYLIFADDLLVFARGDYPSIKAVESCLHSFAEYSGLQPNPSKTNIYFGGVHPQVKELVLRDTSYLEGTFPFRYLGIPLHSSRLTRDMYHSLIEKIKGKITHWANSLLSYAGKVQLLNSVIFGIENFWCASFILPKGVIQEMDRLCRQFLWNYQTGRKMIFFAWSKVCRARQQGGFDIREILSWNKTPSMKLFGKSPRVLDLFGYFGATNTSSRGMIAGLWLLVVQLPQLKALLHTRDEFISQWHPTLQWTRPLMDPVVMPRHAVITRMAVQNGLPTVDNLIRRGMVMVNGCVLCLADMESIRHLFFACPYSHDVMQRVLLWLGLTRRPLCLRQELLKLSRYKGKGWRKKWARCCIAAAVYLIWQERNRRLFDRGSRSVEQLVNQIKYFVSIRLYANVSDSLLEEIVSQMIP